MWLKIEEVRKELVGLKQGLDEKIDSSLGTKILDFETRFQRLELDLEKKIIDMHQSYNKQLFEILESFLRWNKEISLVSYLGGKEPDLKKLKIELMRPMMEENWNKNHAEEAEKINKALESKGEKIRKARDQYQEDFLVAQREGKDTQVIEAKLEVLNKLVE